MGKRKASKGGAAPRQRPIPKRAKNHKTQSDPWEASREETHEVEKIVAMRYNLKFGKKEYCTQWIGYEEKDNTWEPLENLVGAVEEVRLFEDAQEN